MRCNLQNINIIAKTKNPVHLRERDFYLRYCIKAVAAQVHAAPKEHKEQKM